MKFKKTLNEGLFKTQKEKQIVQIRKKYNKTLESLKKINDPYYYKLKQKMDAEIEALEPQKERDWDNNEIEQWISLDDRKLAAQIDSGGMMEPMDPLEIRAKHIYKSFDMFGPDDSFENIKKGLIKEYGQDAWNLAIEKYDIPSTQTEWESYYEG